MSSVHRVISGGQVGADIAGLRAAKAVGLPTGGCCPRGWRIKGGSNPELGEVYGLIELPTDSYKKRTWKNVSDADATVRYAYDFNSPGERCTRNACEYYEKLLVDVPIYFNGKTGWYIKYSPKVFRDVLNKWNVQVLNVAGNANVSIEDCVEKHLRGAL
jgi:hypothetical protein